MDATEPKQYLGTGPIIASESGYLDFLATGKWIPAVWHGSFASN